PRAPAAGVQLEVLALAEALDLHVAPGHCEDLRRSVRHVTDSTRPLVGRSYIRRHAYGRPFGVRDRRPGNDDRDVAGRGVGGPGRPRTGPGAAHHPEVVRAG